MRKVLSWLILSLLLLRASSVTAMVCLIFSYGFSDIQQLVTKLLTQKLDGLTCWLVVACRTARHTEYSKILPEEEEGGSHERCAPSTDLEIFMADGAPGKPGKQVLKADT